MGYHQNPISVYYCYTPDGDLEICIAEVTNTPWGERVRFLFKPDRDVVPKSLHVSPFIDMHRCWQLEASDPCVEILSAKQPGRTKRGAPKGSGDEAVFVMAPQLVLSVTCLPNCPEGSALFAVLKSSPSHTTVSVRGSLLLPLILLSSPLSLLPLPLPLSLPLPPPLTLPADDRGSPALSLPLPLPPSVPPSPSL